MKACHAAGRSAAQQGQQAPRRALRCCMKFSMTLPCSKTFLKDGIHAFKARNCTCRAQGLCLSAAFQQ